MDEFERFRRTISLTGNVATDAHAFLVAYELAPTAIHCGCVAAEARRVALLCGVDAAQAETAGWLHDVSAVIPNSERINVARAWDVPVLPEEEQFPMIIHQKLSVVLAREVFGVHDAAVLSAIGCHTTLKRDASVLDKVVFVADKLEWDQPGKAPFHDAMHAALAVSLDHAAAAYLSFLWERRDTLRVVHPWLRDASEQWVERSGRDADAGSGVGAYLS
jgi:predicted HD superfamily hydrolase involved in NAD metabolism